MVKENGILKGDNSVGQKEENDNFHGYLNKENRKQILNIFVSLVLILNIVECVRDFVKRLLVNKIVWKRELP